MSTISNQALLTDTPGTLNKHDTVIWGRDPLTHNPSVQFLKGPTREYLTRAAAINEARDRLTPLDWAVYAGAAIIALGSVAGVISLLVNDSWLPDLMWVLFPTFFVFSLAVGGSYSTWAANRADERLKDDLDALTSQYAVTITPDLDDGDFRERNGNSPFSAAMDRITPEARDDLIALLESEDYEAVENIVQTLVKEERNRLDSQKTASAGRIADITARVVRKAPSE